MIKEITTKNSIETQKLGEDFAKEILASEFKNSAVVLGLQGDLGTGKTTFLQGFAKGLGITEKILSPTFIIMRKFKIQKPHAYRQAGKFKITISPRDVPRAKQNSKYKTQKNNILKSGRSSRFEYKYFYHFDCYRLKNEKDVEVLDFKKIISNPENIVAIEWPEKVKKILPKNTISIMFNHLEENKRELIIQT